MNIKKNIEELLFNSGISGNKIANESGVPQSTVSRFLTGESKLGNMKLDHAITLNDYYIKLKGEIEMNYLVTATKHENFVNDYGMEMEEMIMLESGRAYSSEQAENLAKKHYDNLEDVDYIEIIAPNAQDAVCYWSPQGASATSFNWCEYFEAGGEI